MILYIQIIKLNCDCKVVMISVIFKILSIQKEKWFFEHHERPRVFAPTVREMIRLSLPSSNLSKD